MSTTTTNLGLVKPELTDAADITAMNQNWDKIDEKLNNVCTSITDWDAATANGWYMGNSAANAPGTGWYFGRVIAHNSNYVLQEVYQFSASSDAKYIPKYIRAKKDGTWGAWVDVTVQTKVPVDAILNGAKQDLSNVTDDTIQSKVNAVFAKKIFAPYCVELTPPEDSTNGGFLDFHFGGDTSKDYTARIIEDVLGELRVIAKLKVDGDLYENRVNRVYSTGNKPTPADIGAADASSHNIKTYTNLSQLGLANGATMSQVARALPDGSELRMYVLTSENANLAPTTTNGWLEVVRPSANHVEFRYTSTSRMVYHAVVLNVNNANEQVSVWTEVATKTEPWTITYEDDTTRTVEVYVK